MSNQRPVLSRLAANASTSVVLVAPLETVTFSSSPKVASWWKVPTTCWAPRPSVEMARPRSLPAPPALPGTPSAVS